jgi:hypothetical protein
MHVLPLKEKAGRDRLQARRIVGEPLAREEPALSDELSLDEIARGNDRLPFVEASSLGRIASPLRLRRADRAFEAGNDGAQRVSSGIHRPGSVDGADPLLQLTDD